MKFISLVIAALLLLFCVWVTYPLGQSENPTETLKTLFKGGS